MWAVRSVIVLSALILCGQPGCSMLVATGELPDGFSVSACSQGQYVYFPLGEAGIEYQFVGIGWILYDQRGRFYSIKHHDRPIVDSYGALVGSLPAGWSSTRSMNGRAIIVGGTKASEPGGSEAIW